MDKYTQSLPSYGQVVGSQGEWHIWTMGTGCCVANGVKGQGAQGRGNVKRGVRGHTPCLRNHVLFIQNMLRIIFYEMDFIAIESFRKIFDELIRTWILLCRIQTI